MWDFFPLTLFNIFIIKMPFNCIRLTSFDFKKKSGVRFFSFDSCLRIFISKISVKIGSQLASTVANSLRISLASCFSHDVLDFPHIRALSQDRNVSRFKRESGILNWYALSDARQPDQKPKTYVGSSILVTSASGRLSLRERRDYAAFWSLLLVATMWWTKNHRAKWEKANYLSQ